MFNTEAFHKELSTSWLGRELFFFDKLDSTNSFAKQFKKDELLHGAIILADEQEKGRGQYDRSWESSPLNNLTFSIVLNPSHTERFTLLTLAIALSITEVLDHHLSIKDSKIKWPNDIVINGKKIAGLLTETVFNGNKLSRLIIGIGLNVNEDSFPAPLANLATSIKNETKKDSSRERLLARLLSNIEFRYRLWETLDIELVKNINKKMMGYGEWASLTVDDKLLEGEFKFLGVNENGQMVVLNKELEVNTFSYEQVRVGFTSESS